MSKKPTRAELEATIQRQRVEAENARSEIREQKSLAATAMSRAEETRSNFEDLKKRLLEAETEVARLTGYLARVHEDDIVRDGLVEVMEGDVARQVPKRPPPLMGVQRYQPQETASGDFYDVGGRLNRRQTHWTSY